MMLLIYLLCAQCARLSFLDPNVEYDKEAFPAEDTVQIYQDEQPQNSGRYLAEVFFPDRNVREVFVESAPQPFAPVWDLLEVALKPPGLVVKVMVATQDLLRAAERHGLTIADVNQFSKAFEKISFKGVTTSTVLHGFFNDLERWHETSELRRALNQLLEVLTEMNLHQRQYKIPTPSAVAYMGPLLEDDLITTDPEMFDACLAHWEANYFKVVEQLHRRVPFEESWTISQFWEYLLTAHRHLTNQMANLSVLPRTQSLRLAYAQVILNCWSNSVYQPTAQQFSEFDNFVFNAIQRASYHILSTVGSMHMGIPQLVDSLCRHLRPLLTPARHASLRSFGNLEQLLNEIIFVTVYGARRGLVLPPVDNIFSFFSDEQPSWEKCSLIHLNSKILRRILQNTSRPVESYFYGTVKRLLQASN